MKSSWVFLVHQEIGSEPYKNVLLQYEWIFHVAFANRDGHGSGMDMVYPYLTQLVYP